jgi:AraC family transcriptional regulator of adaptative response/methylated-DNA-[protein]-cysteine methyltransferase
MITLRLCGSNTLRRCVRQELSRGKIMHQTFTQQSLDFERIEKVVEYIESNFKQQPELEKIAGHVGLSEFHLQRLFKRWVGISPKRFLQYLTKEHAKSLLRQSENVLSVTYDAGLSGPGRLHDLFVNCEAVTPGEYKQMGQGVRIYYGIHQTPFGRCLIAKTDRGICGLFFLKDKNGDEYVQRLKRDWPNANIEENPIMTGSSADEIFDLNSWERNRPISLFVKGTNFQIKIWEALLKIPSGNVVAYEEIAQFIGNPHAVRAVGSAVAKNPVSYLIPCHRVIRKYGEFGNYQGGTARKKAILAWETTHI